VATPVHSGSLFYRTFQLGPRVYRSPDNQSPFAATGYRQAKNAVRNGSMAAPIAAASEPIADGAILGAGR
jgi:hypothetical protein